MKIFTYHKPELANEKETEVVIVAARYQDQWVFCRQKGRGTWELPGGHREAGETLEETAKRELWEETGAVEAEITPVFLCCSPSFSTLLCFAKIRKMDPLWENSEMEEIRMFDYIPEELTYPAMCRELFDCIQGWRNLQSNAGELWDIYDENRKLTGRLHRRGELMEPGDYHLVVHIWIQNCKGEFLLTKRSPNKGFPGMWETTGGSALAGDDSLTSALREVQEETGLILDAQKGTCILQLKHTDHFADIWLFRQEFNLEDVHLQEGETCDKMSADTDKIRELSACGKLVPYTYLDQVLEIAGNKHVSPLE